MIELKNVSKTYQMGTIAVKALNDVSLRIDDGEFVAIIGPSGSGKSTLMHILGLLDRPDTGTYVFNESELTAMSDEECATVRNGLVGFVFQRFHLLPHMTALENVELPLIYAGKRHLKDRAREKIVMIGLENRLLHHPNELSGGQQQRVAIARALVNEPPILLADEPTGNLDSKNQEDILSILEKLHSDGKTVIVVTHEKEIAERADRIIHMHDGMIINDERRRVTKDSTGSDASKSLINALQSRHLNKMGRAKFLDYIQEAFFSVVSHKMRSLLSIIGILVGVAAVISMLSVGAGATDDIEARLASLGSNLLLVCPSHSRVHGVALEDSSITRLTFQDVTAIKRLPLAKSASASVSGRGQIVYANKNWNTRIEGVDVDYAQMRASIPIFGRFFYDNEVQMREKVTVLGSTVAQELFGTDNPVGKIVKINLNNFRVVGVLPSKGGGGFGDQDDIALMPVTTAMYRMLGKNYVETIYVEGESLKTLDLLTESIKQLIAKRHHINQDKDIEDLLQIWNMADVKNALESTTKTMSLLLGSIATISLIVGGIGIMNIMLVSVTERTREIGLRKALGAHNKDIMVQFLIEALLMTVLGGVFGIILGSGVSFLITVFAGWEVRISALSILLATAFSIAVGLVFGLWPAKQASRLNPIEALRYE